MLISRVQDWEVSQGHFSKIEAVGEPAVVHFYTLFTLQPPGPQHRPHYVFRPGEDQQQHPPIQEGQGILLYWKIQPKVRGDECEEIELEKNCKSQLIF